MSTRGVVQAITGYQNEGKTVDLWLIKTLHTDAYWEDGYGPEVVEYLQSEELILDFDRCKLKYPEYFYNVPLYRTLRGPDDSNRWNDYIYLKNMSPFSIDIPLGGDYHSDFPYCYDADDASLMCGTFTLHPGAIAVFNGFSCTVSNDPAIPFQYLHSLSTEEYNLLCVQDKLADFNEKLAAIAEGVGQLSANITTMQSGVRSAISTSLKDAISADFKRRLKEVGRLESL